MSDAALRLGVDLGGTKIEALALDLRGVERVRRRTPTPQGDYEATVRAVAELARAVEREAGGDGAAPLGVATPGAISPATGLIKNANSTALNGRPLDRDLAAAAARPVRLENDANCFALSEAADGAAAGAAVVFGVIAGTGVGGGVVVHGRVVKGANAIGGEWGHTPLPLPRDDERPGPDCYCGRRGCVEAWCSGPALAAEFRRVAPGALAEPVTAETLVAAADRGHAQARAALQRHTDRFARALAQIVNILDPDVIVLGGGLSNLPHWPEQLTEALEPHVFSDRVDTRIVRHRHGDSSGVRGAAWLWPIAAAAAGRIAPNEEDPR